MMIINPSINLPFGSYDSPIPRAIKLTASYDSPVHRTVAFTTPENYATRLSDLFHRRNWTPLWCPTVVVEPTSATNSALHHISQLDTNNFSAVAFTSRAGISAFSRALSSLSSPPLSSSGDTFTISALGTDAELLTPNFLANLCPNPDRVRLVVPATSTPSGLAESLGSGLGRKVLCPVPLVSGLQEPPVVPDFLRDLGQMGWDPTRVDAYVTRWAGSGCASGLVERDNVDGLIYTSTAEVEGLLKGLNENGLGWEDVRKKWLGLVVAAHGPVTASGQRGWGLGLTWLVIGLVVLMGWLRLWIIHLHKSSSKFILIIQYLRIRRDMFM